MIKRFILYVWPAVVIFMIAFVFLYFMDLDFDFLKENLSGNSKEVRHIASLHDASLIILTLIIACVAWIQLKAISRNGQAEFLLTIDQRYSDPAIIRARKIIHFMYKESQNKNPDAGEDCHCENIAKMIFDLGEIQDPSLIKKNTDYVYLLNFLDFLETVSLFANKGHVSVDEISDLMDNSLDFFFKIFKTRIDERRRKYKNPMFYGEFEDLFEKLKCRKRRCTICFRCLLGVRHVRDAQRFLC